MAGRYLRLHTLMLFGILLMLGCETVGKEYPLAGGGEIYTREIVTEPSDAEISVDGTPIGKTPITLSRRSQSLGPVPQGWRRPTSSAVVELHRLSWKKATTLAAFHELKNIRDMDSISEGTDFSPRSKRSTGSGRR